MKQYKNVLMFFSTIVLCGAVVAAVAAPVHASVTPTLTLTNGNGGTSGQIVVYGDFGSQVQLHYGPSASRISMIGTTDSYGNLVLPIGLDSYAVSCGNTAYVVINNQQSATIPWSLNSGTCTANSNGNISFSQTNVLLNIGQSQTVVVYGSGTFSISNNSNSSVVSTAINGNVLTLSALSFGGANVTVCESSDGQCGTISVAAVNTATQTGTNVITTGGQAPAISSFMVASDNANGGFVRNGNTLTLTFNGNKPLTNVSVKVANNPLIVSGGAAGPYTVSYKLTGSESSLVPVVVTFGDTSGNMSQATFALGNTAAVVTPTPVPAPTPAPAPAPVPTPTPVPVQPSTAKPAVTFSEFLKLNSTGAEVTALQKRLVSLGFYSGPITGTFGPLTEAAVKKLQKAHGLAQAGYVGPSTRAVLNK